MPNLAVNDYVGISFWLISIALAATTGFLVVERRNVKPKWKTPVSVSALVTGIAASHYFYMRRVWVKTGESPIVYRYIDWFLTVPLQIIEFYLILSVAKKIPQNLFYKLLLASFLMILFGFLGETGQMDRNLGFVLGTGAWLYILYEIFFGEASKLKKETDDESIRFTFDALKWIVTIGWAIYPIGYLLEKTNMNLLYNLGDLVNKILFGLVIWYAGKGKFSKKVVDESETKLLDDSDNLNANNHNQNHNHNHNHNHNQNHNNQELSKNQNQNNNQDLNENQMSDSNNDNTNNTNNNIVENSDPLERQSDNN